METSDGEIISSKNIVVPEKEVSETSKPINPEENVSQDDQVVPTKGRLCLNMIVKNESRIIERLLTSVLSIVDTYCICDTGSTDDTKEKIRNFMSKHNKPGIVFTEPFKNFGYNRSVALKRADDWGEYALLLDADMKLVIRPDFLEIKNKLDLDGYMIMQKNGDLKYFNTRIIKTGIGVTCVSPTHEYYDFPKDAKQVKMDCLFIDDIGDGGSKADKFTRDIRLLKEGLEEDPKNGRYHFYIANSYKNIGQFEEAIKWYKKRVEIGGWIEEVFYSLFETGNAYSDLRDYEKAIYYWLEAWNRHPRRSESLYEIVKYYRIHSKHHLAQHFCLVGKSIPYPKDDVLFIKHSVYDYLFDYEQSILYYYTKLPVDYKIFPKLIGKNCHKDNVMSNYQFYTKKIKDFAKQHISFNDKVEKEIAGVTDNFVSSSPCIIPHSESGKDNKVSYLMNVRYVNYTIQPNGSYSFKLDDGKIRTLNKFVYLNKDFKEVKNQWFDKVHDPDIRYQGVEDVKLFPNKGKIIFSGTIENNGVLRIGYNDVNFKTNFLYPIAIESPFGQGCEKNWVFCNTSDGTTKMIYSWSPLIHGEINETGDRLTKLKRDTEVPEFFRELRGSTNGCRIGEEIWFLCHLVHYTTPRHYYNVIVVLDAKTLKYKRNSIIFKFETEKIEYCLGMIVEPKQVIFSYSTMDRTSSILTMTRNKLEEELFP